MLSKLDKKFGIRKKLIEPLAPRVDPNIVSALGFLTGPLAGWFLWNRELMLAIIFIFLNALSDLFDGTIAKKYGTASKKGSLIDDMADRVSDISIAIGLGGMAGNPFLGGVAAVVLVLNSYLSLQGLALYGKKAKFGLFSRANRTAVIFTALVVSPMVPADVPLLLLWLTIVLGAVTVIQRAAHLLGEAG
jgi:phosphatidylglycerophosphate synthase